MEGGDLLRAWQSGAQQWTIENGGDKDGTGPYVPTSNQTNLQGPGGGEFYYDEKLGGVHEETAMGAVAILAGSEQAVATVNDPFQGNSSGTTKHDSNTGAASEGYELRLGKNTRSFGKAAGLGDLELICDPAPLEIGNRVWIDANRNGIQDAGELNFPGVAVVLTDASGNTYTATTNNTGEHYFNNSNVTGGLLPNQTYTVTINTAQTALASYKLTAANIVTPSTTLSDGIDSDGILAGNIAQVTVTPAGAGQNNHTIDFGFCKALFSLGNRVWFDTNNDGLDNDGAAGALGTGVAGVTVQLFDANNTLTATATTGASGYYRFDNLPAGDYTVVLPASNFAGGGKLQDYQNSTPTFNTAADANDNGSVSGVLGSGGDVRSALITLAAGAMPTGETGIGGGSSGLLGDSFDNLTIDFGFYKLTLGNRVWLDTNRNGLDDIETGMAGIPVTLTNGFGVVISTTKTDAHGFYTFTNLISDTYVVQIQASTGYVSIPDDASANTDINDNGQGNAGGTISSQPFNLTPGLASGGVTVNAPSGQTHNPTIDFGLYLPSADLQVLKSVIPSTYVLGVANPVVYTLIITNFGPDTVINVPVTDTQPTNVTFNSWTCVIQNGGASDACSAAAGSGNILTTVSLHAGASAVWTINATIGTAATGPLTNTVSEALPAGMTQGLINRQDTASVSVLPTQPLFSVGNRVWFDTNDDGAVGPGVVAGPVNVLMQLVDAAGSVLQTHLTDANGYYRFDNVPAGTYQVVVAPSNFQVGGPLEGYRNSSGVTTTTDLNSDNHDHGLNTSPNPAIDGVASVSVTLGLGLQPIGEAAVGGGTDGPHSDANSNLTLDFGFNRPQLGNQLWFDTNNNGIYEPGAGELPVPAGVIVNLHAIYFGADIVALTATTDVNGRYLFQAGNNVDYAPQLVASGDLTLYVAIPPGQPALNSYVPSSVRQPSGGIDNHNIGVLDATGLITSGTFYLFPGDPSNGAIISDAIGLTIAGVITKLFDSAGTEISSTVTDASGFYRFDGLLAGSYSVQVAADNFVSGGPLYGYRNSAATTASSNNTADDNHDHGINVGQPGVDGKFSSQFTLGHGLQPVGEANGANGPGGDATDNLTIDFGFYKLALGNLVWIDQNNNGVLDASDKGGLDGVTVRLFASDGITEIPVGPDGVWGTADQPDPQHRHLLHGSADG